MSCTKVSRPRAVAIVLIALAALAAVLLTANCATLRLENRLSKDAKAWYLDHKILMQTEVPALIAGRRHVSEADYFLSLPPAQQELYRAMFWRMRRPGAQATFEFNRNLVRLFFNGNKRSAMAETLLLCGLPEEVYVYTAKGKFIGQAQGILDDKGYWNVVNTWTYYYDSYRVVVAFESQGSEWYPYARSAVSVSEQHRFFQWCRAFFAPTGVGWVFWEEAIG